MAEQTGTIPPDLILPEYPEELGYLLEWARSLIRAEPLSYTEIRNWADLTRTLPATWEVEILMQIDSIFHRVKSERNG